MIKRPPSRRRSGSSRDRGRRFEDAEPGCLSVSAGPALPQFTETEDGRLPAGSTRASILPSVRPSLRGEDVGPGTVRPRER